MFKFNYEEHVEVIEDNIFNGITGLVTKKWPMGSMSNSENVYSIEYDDDNGNSGMFAESSLRLIEAHTVPLAEKRSFTLEEMIPKVIKDLNDLRGAVQNSRLNSYQTGLILTAILYSLEHPEKHFSDGTIIF